MAIGVAVALVAASMFWSDVDSKGEAQIERLSDRERAALYQRTLADLRLCATGAGASLSDHCAHQAQLILAFPECDAPCRQLVEPWKTMPSR